jgi:hypothetical protein
MSVSILRSIHLWNDLLIIQPSIQRQKGTNISHICNQYSIWNVDRYLQRKSSSSLECLLKSHQVKLFVRESRAITASIRKTPFESVHLPPVDNPSVSTLSWKQRRSPCKSPIIAPSSNLQYNLQGGDLIQSQCH